MRLRATCVHFVNAIFLTAHVSKTWLWTKRWLFERLPAVAALKSDAMVLRIFAVHSDVVGLLLATGTEVLCTVGTPHTVLGHVLCCLTCHIFASFVLGCIIWLTRLEAENLSAARALHNTLSIVHHHLGLLLADVLQKLLTEGFSEILC